jgi:hypothetical protein
MLKQLGEIMNIKKLNCGCYNFGGKQFIREAALVDSRVGSLTRKPLAVQRAYAAICPTHGKVTVVADGHHCSSDATVGYEAAEPWQAVAFAGMMLHEGDA